MSNIKFINSGNLNKNIDKFSSKKICAMVKSNAYGHGLSTIVKLIEDKVDSFGVVNVSEGAKVRELTNKSIIVCSKVFDFMECKKQNLDFFVDDENSLLEAIKAGLKDHIHLKINCGMNRYGVKSVYNMKILNSIIAENEIKLKSISTHFPDTCDKRKTLKNYRFFQDLSREITQKSPICFGGSNIINYPFDFDILRLGIGMYGYGKDYLFPVMTICSSISKIFYAKRGEYIGYGEKYKVFKDSLFGIIPVGYGDGLRRNLSDKFKVLINGKEYKSVGNICMDTFFVKIDEEVKVGDKVEILSNAEKMASKTGTISYEILTGFSNFRGKTIIV